jgi:predicted RNase H-like HicB family nuclease
MSDIKTSRKSVGSTAVELPQSEWKRPSRTLYRCKVIILFPPEEESGLIAVYAANLPGVASQGTTEEEALQNIVEAFEGVLATYRESGEEIPWQEDTNRQLERGAEVRWVFVHG